MAPVTRSATTEEEALFKKIKTDFTRRIMAEGVTVTINAVEKDPQDVNHFTYYVIANGIAYTIKFTLEEGDEINVFTVEKTKKKSSCTLL